MFLENRNSEEYKVKPGKIKRIASFKITWFLKNFLRGLPCYVSLPQTYPPPASASLCSYRQLPFYLVLI